MDATFATPPRRRADPVLLVLLALSLLANVALALKLRQASAAASRPPGMQAGATVPPLQARDAAGRRVTLGPGEATVYYAFSPTCPWCRRNREAVAALALARSPGFRFVGVCLGEEAGCRETARDYPFPVYTGLDPRAATELGLGRVPQTLVVSAAGRVLRVLPGAFLGAAKSEVERYFDLELPEVPALPPAASPGGG